MRALAQALAVIVLLSSGVPCFAKEMGKTERSSSAPTTRSQEPGESQLKPTNQRLKDTHRLDQMWTSETGITAKQAATGGCEATARI